MISQYPWVDVPEPEPVADWEFVCPECNLVKPKRLATTLGRYVVCEACGV